jgi:hypothetical protein
VRQRYFIPARKKLQSILDQAQLYRDILCEGTSLARALGVPLMSDDLAKGIHSMFKSPGPHVSDPEKLACNGNISWLDVVRETNYQAEKQPDGSYIYYLRKQGIPIRLSGYQHGLLLSGLPQQLVQPWSFEKDVRAERDVLRLTAGEISTWNRLASEGEHHQRHTSSSQRSLTLCRSH